MRTSVGRNLIRRVNLSSQTLYFRTVGILIVGSMRASLALPYLVSHKVSVAAR